MAKEPTLQVRHETFTTGVKDQPWRDCLEADVVEGTLAIKWDASNGYRCTPSTARSRSARNPNPPHRPHRRPTMPDRYRTGRHLGRTLYRDDQLIGIMDHPDDAAKIVKLLNLRDKLATATDHHVLDDVVMDMVLMEDE